MKATCKTFTIEITEHEVEIVRRALEAFVGQKAAEYNETHKEEAYNASAQAKVLRNDFAGLIGVHYMGRDA